MHVSRLVFCLILAVTAGCESRNSANNIDSFLESGYQYLEQGQFQAALIESRNALKEDPENEESHVLLGKIYLELGRPKQALTFLDDIEGSTRDYYETLVEAYIERRKFDSALKVLDQQSASFEANPVTQKLLTARARTGRQEYDKAQALYQEVLGLDEGNVKARLGLATLQAVKGNLAQAERDVDAVLETASENVEALLLRGAIQIQRENLDEAEATLTDALSALPTTDVFTVQRAQLLRALVDLLSRQGRSGEALVYQRMLAKAFPGAQEREERLATAIENIRAGNLEQAERELTGLDEEAPTNETTGYLLGMINYIQGKPEEAQQYFDQSIDPEIASPGALKSMSINLYEMNQLDQVVDILENEAQKSDDPELLTIYGVAAINTNQQEAGVKALERALSLDPDNSRLFLVLAQHYSKLNPPQHKKALSELETALSRAPDNLNVQAMYLNQLLTMKRIDAAQRFVNEKSADESLNGHQLAGAFYLQMQDFAAAIEHFNRAVKLDPETRPAHVGLAMSYMATEQWSDARAHYRKATELDPDDIRAYRGLMEAYAGEGLSTEGFQELQGIANDTDNNVPAVVVTEYLAANNQWNEVESRLEQLTRQAPDSPHIQRLNVAVNYRHAVTALRNNEYDAARSAVFKALDSQPTNQRLLELLARLEIRSGKYREAEKVINEVENAYPDSRFTHVLAADLAATRKQYGEALERYELAWQQQPTDDLGAKLFHTYVDAGKVEEAEAFSHEWQSALPNTSVMAVINRAQLYDDKARAIKTYETAPESLRESPVFLNNLAWLYYETGQHGKGLALAERAQKLAPGNPSIMDTYGWLLFEHGEHEKAIDILVEAARLAPDQPEIHEHLRIARNQSSG